MQTVIPHAKRSNELLKRNIPCIIENLGRGPIVVLTDRDNVPVVSRMLPGDVSVMDEDSVAQGLGLGAIKAMFAGTIVPERRVGWYFQQYLKMAWARRSDCEQWYLVWDSDTFPLRPIDFFDSEGFPWYTGSSEHNPVYFETMDALLGLERQVDHSFIAENMLIKRDVMRELIGRIEGGAGRRPFFQAITGAVLGSSDPYRAFSEFELYGNYVAANHPGLYRRTTRSSSRKGARRFGLAPSRADLARLARRYEIVSFERWDRIVAPIVALNKLLSFIMFPLTRNRKK